MTLFRHFAVACLVVSGAACSCGTDPMPPDMDFDGNVVIGMGGPDSGPRDAGGSDSGFDDAGDEMEDAGTEDTGVFDAGTGDAGEPDAGDRCAEPSTMTLSAAAAVAQASVLNGQLLTIVGTATRTPYRCSMIPCSDEMPCCNTCSADMSIEGVIALTADACFGADVRCTGTECAQVCVPAIFGVDERFTGRIFEGPPIRLELYDVAP